MLLCYEFLFGSAYFDFQQILLFVQTFTLIFYKQQYYVIILIIHSNVIIILEACIDVLKLHFMMYS
jgi:hypothetical protein